MEYFDLYCASLIAPTEEAAVQRALLPLLKTQLQEYRLAILDPRAAQPFLRREAELRAPPATRRGCSTLAPAPEIARAPRGARASLDREPCDPSRRAASTGRSRSR